MAVSRSQPPLSRVRILMVSGGTGGHIFPALAVAQELISRPAAGSSRYEIEFLGTRRPLEAKLIPAAGFPLRTVDAAGLKGIRGIQRLRNLWVLPQDGDHGRRGRFFGNFDPRLFSESVVTLRDPLWPRPLWGEFPLLLIEPNVRPGVTESNLLAPAGENCGARVRGNGAGVRQESPRDRIARAAGFF